MATRRRPARRTGGRRSSRARGGGGGGGAITRIGGALGNLAGRAVRAVRGGGG